jgi:hypothetical protein
LLPGPLSTCTSHLENPSSPPPLIPSPNDTT